MLTVGPDGGVPLAGPPTPELGPGRTSSGPVGNTRAYLFAEEEPYDGEQVRPAYVPAGDTIALLTRSRKGGAPGAPFHRSVILQNQLPG
ncbi:hypothetical protein [Streptomyces enissocaesilis]|uniref:Uncharacterized protein n=1 Tax=Streptomyces enissocaesilis TaxID=332589 RepID=A0ABP6K0Z0_9ACTN